MPDPGIWDLVPYPHTRASALVILGEAAELEATLRRGLPYPAAGLTFSRLFGPQCLLLP